MMYWIVDWSIRFRRIVVVLAAGLLIFGFTQLDDVKQDILPEFSPVTVEVQTEALGLSAAEVEQLITVPLEQDLLNGVAFLDSIESASLPGLSSVVMTFEPGTDLLDARQVVTERLTQAGGLPQVADPPQMIQPLSSTSRVAMVSLQSDEVTPIEMSVLARWVMLPRLLGVEGVANVSIWGFRDQQLQVLVDPAELATANVTLSQIISTTGNALEVSPLSFLEASLPGTGGFIDTVNQRLHVFHEQAIDTPEELSQVTVEGIDGGAVFVGGDPLALGEVAEIVTGHQPLIGDARCTDGPCLLLVIEKFPESNTPAVAAGVDEALAALSLGMPGVEIDASVYRPASFIEASTGNLRTALIAGAVLLLLALAAFLFDWRVVLIGAVSVAVSVVTAGLVFLVTDTTVNLMVLAGIVMALAMIVNDSIAAASAAAEAATASGESEGPVKATPAIMDVTLRLRSVAMYAALIVAAAMLPVIAMEGAGGAFLEPIAVAYLIAVAAALAVGLVVTPALSVMLLTGPSGSPRVSPLTHRMSDWYRHRAPGLVAKTGSAVAVWAVVLVAGLVAALFVSPSLRPAVKERDVLIQLEAAAGTSLVRMDDITAQMVDDLIAQPGVVNVGAHIGRAIMSDRVVNVNSGEIWLNIEPAADYDATMASVRALVAGYDEVAASVTTYSEQRVAEILRRPDDRLVVRVYGENPAVRQEMAEQVLSVVAGVDGVEDPRIESVVEEPAIEIEVDLARAQAFGIKPGDVRRQAATLVSGLVVGNLFDDQKVFDVVVWGVPEIRDTVEDLQRLPIATPSGDQVPLGDLAEVRIESNPAVVLHESTATYLDVTAAVSGRTISSAAADIDAAVAAIQFPLEHHAEVLGDFEDELAARSRVVVTAVAGAILIYLLLQAAFASWRLATLAFLALPMAAGGSIVAVALGGGDLTLGSVAGTVAVFGLATHWVVLLIRRCQYRERLGDPFGEALVVEESTRAIAISAVGAVAVAVLYLPLAIVGSRAGLEIAGPMAVAVLGGLVTTVALTAFVLPVFYTRWGYVAEPDRSADDLFTSDLSRATSAGA